MRIVAVVAEEAHLVRKSELARLSFPLPTLSARRFALRPISPEDADPPMLVHHEVFLTHLNS